MNNIIFAQVNKQAVLGIKLRSKEHYLKIERWQGPPRDQLSVSGIPTENKQIFPVMKIIISCSFNQTTVYLNIDTFHFLLR